MSIELAVVFPAANTMGGVERVALQVVTHVGRTRGAVFVGEQLQGQPAGVEFRLVQTRGGATALHPRRFRRAAAAVLASDRPNTVLSFGVECPPGDVLWVQSVHQAWLESGSAVQVGGVSVPTAARRLLPRHRVLLRLERQYFTGRRPRAVLCTSQREADDLRRLYGVPDDVMHVVPNGYDRHRFRAADRARLRGPVRARMGIDKNDISLLFVANELHRKGFGVLLDAVARTSDPRLRVDVIGRAPLDGYRAQLQRLGLTERVHWHGPTSEVEKALSAGDLLVLPTQYEPFGLVVVEALASGLPVITTRRAGASAAVVPGTGLLQDDPDDVDELTGLLEQATQPGRLAAWSRAAPEAARPYEWDTVLTRAESFIFDAAG